MLSCIYYHLLCLAILFDIIMGKIGYRSENLNILAVQTTCAKAPVVASLPIAQKTDRSMSQASPSERELFTLCSKQHFVARRIFRISFGNSKTNLMCLCITDHSSH